MPRPTPHTPVPWEYHQQVLLGQRSRLVRRTDHVAQLLKSKANQGPGNAISKHENEPRSSQVSVTTRPAARSQEHSPAQAYGRQGLHVVDCRLKVSSRTTARSLPCLSRYYWRVYGRAAVNLQRIMEIPVSAIRIFLPSLIRDPAAAGRIKRMSCLGQSDALEAALSLLDDFEPLDDFGLLPDEGEQQAEHHELDAGQLGPSANDTGAAATAALDSDAASTVTTAAVAKKPAKRTRTKNFNPNRARYGRQQELLYLRRQVREMEQQLKRLKIQGPNDTTGLGLQLDASLTMWRDRVRSAESRSSPWEQLAVRRYEERRQAELMNIRLTTLLKDQLKTATGIERLLNRRSNTQILQYLDDDGTQRRRPQYVMPSHEKEEDIFRMLLSGLDEAVKAVDDVFQTNGLRQTDREFQDAAIRNDYSNRKYLEVTGNKFMPFDMHTSSNAVWQHIKGLIERMPFRAYYERQPKFVQSTNQIIVETYDLELHAQHASAYFRVYKVLRRYVSQDRIVIAWREAMDPIQYASQPVSGVRFLEQGYIVLKPAASVAATGQTLMQTCIQLRPYRYGHDRPEHEIAFGQLSNFFLDTLARNVYFNHRMIEGSISDQPQACV